MPTIRRRMTIGLVQSAQVTPARYQLFSPEAVDRCRRIQALKGRRFTLAEIRDTIDGPAAEA